MVCRLDSINETEYNKYIIMFKQATCFYAPVLRHLNANAESKYFENLSNLGLSSPSNSVFSCL